MRHEKRIRLTAAEEWKNRRKRLRLECRECEIICERVVSPWHCLKASCPYVYVFEDVETSYFGCLHKVFAPELDLEPFAGATGGGRRGGDPYGSLRVTRSPRPECRITIEQAYAAAHGGVTCCNPTFFQHPASPVDEGIRLITSGRSDPGTPHPDAGASHPEN